LHSLTGYQKDRSFLKPSVNWSNQPASGTATTLPKHFLSNLFAAQADLFRSAGSNRALSPLFSAKFVQA
jgi:hypothetical protein